MGIAVQLNAHSETDEVTELRLQVRGFVTAEIRDGVFVPRCDSWMSASNPAFSASLGARGLLGRTLPLQYGGQARSPLERFAISEELLAAGAPVAAHWIADRQMAPSILAHGSDEQRTKYLPTIASGTCFFAIGMSEPDAGSDLAAVRTRARETPTGWELSGTKVWTTGAHTAHAMVVLARTDEPGSDRRQGLSQFIVDLPGDGVTIRPILTIDGEHHFNEVVFEEALLPTEALLGVRGEGWKQVTSELAFERSGPERVLSSLPLLMAWASEVLASSPNPIADRELGRLTARLWSLRNMSYAVASALASGRTPDVEAALVKDLGSQFESEVVETIRTVVAVMPSAGGNFATLLREAILHMPAFTLRGGSNEILRTIIARGLSQS